MKRVFLIISIVVGLFVVFMVGYSSGMKDITGNAFSFGKDFQIKTCSGGPDRQGTCPFGYLCSAKRNGVCSIKQPIPTQTIPRGSCPNCLVSDKGYREYKIQTDTVDLYNNTNDNNPRTAVKVLSFKAVGVQDRGFTVKKGFATSRTDDDITYVFDTVYIAFNQDGSIINLYRREGGKAVRFDAWGTAPNSLRSWSPYDFAINNSYNFLPIRIGCQLRDLILPFDDKCRIYEINIFDSGTVLIPSRVVIPEVAITNSNLSISFIHDENGSINYLGQRDDGLLDIADILYKNARWNNYAIGADSNDWLLPSMLIVLNPAKNSLKEEVRIKVPLWSGLDIVKL